MYFVFLLLAIFLMSYLPFPVCLSAAHPYCLHLFFCIYRIYLAFICFYRIPLLVLLTENLPDLGMNGCLDDIDFLLCGFQIHTLMFSVLILM